MPGMGMEHLGPRLTLREAALLHDRRDDPLCRRVLHEERGRE